MAVGSERLPRIPVGGQAEPFSRLFPSAALLARAAHWCHELDHPAYDCLYVVLAERERAILITADQRLLRELQQPRTGLPVVIDLANF